MSAKSEALKAYDLKRAVFTSRSILRSQDCSRVYYLNGFVKKGRFWFVEGSATVNGEEMRFTHRKTDIEKAVAAGSLIVSVKDMQTPCDTDEPAHQDAGKMSISMAA